MWSWYYTGGRGCSGKTWLIINNNNNNNNNSNIVVGSVRTGMGHGYSVRGCAHCVMYVQHLGERVFLCVFSVCCECEANDVQFFVTLGLQFDWKDQVKTLCESTHNSRPLQQHCPQCVPIVIALVLVPILPVHSWWRLMIKQPMHTVPHPVWASARQ